MQTIYIVDKQQGPTVYSTGIQHPVINHNEKEHEKVCFIYIYMYMYV